MPSFANLFTTLACLLAVATAVPTKVTRSTEKACTASHTPSALYNIFPEQPDLSKKSIGFHLETYDNSSQVEQVLAFTKIPATAKDCSLGWRQGNRTERVFIVKGGDALTGVRQLSGWPEKEITYDSVKPFDNAKEGVGAADFTNWDDLPAQGHIIGGLPCAESLYFRAFLRNPDGNTKVFLNQNKDNGLYLTYTY